MLDPRNGGNVYHNAIYRVDPGPNLWGCLVWLIAFGLPFGLVTSVLGFV